MDLKGYIAFFFIFLLLIEPPLVLAQTLPRNNASISNALNNLNNIPTDLTNKDALLNAVGRGNFDLTGLGQGLASISVHVVGDIKQPGTYKTSVGTRLSTVLQTALPSRPTFRFVKIKRETQTLTVDYYKFSLFGSLEQNPYLQENDVIDVLPLKKAIQIGGPVSRPGIYELGSEKTIYDVVKLAGGFNSVYQPNLDIEVIRFDDNNQKQIIKISNQDIKSTPVNANDVIVIDSPLNKNTHFDYSLETLPGDKTFYPTSTPQVYVAGTVSAPGAYPYKQHFTVKDYVGFAGINDNVKINSVRVMRNNKLEKISMNAHPNPGEMILLKKKDINQARILTTFLGSLAGIALTILIIDDRIKN